METLGCLLRQGETAAVPTETVYGLAANALDEEACRRVFEIKGRPLIDPLIVHVTGMAKAEELSFPPDAARRLARRFWPGPLTMVMRKKPAVPDLVTAGLPTVAIRAPRHPLIRELMRRSGLALAAPSANPFGCLSPTSARMVRDMLGGRVRHLLDGGPCEIGIESTIVDLTNAAVPSLLRPGAVTREMLEETLETEIVFTEKFFRPVAGTAAPAPGMMERHYSPRTPLFLFNHGGTAPRPPGGRAATVYFRRPPERPPGGGRDCYWLTEAGDMEEAARNVFALLGKLDRGAYTAILAEAAPDEGIGAAINDRLRRAARPAAE